MRGTGMQRTPRVIAGFLITPLRAGALVAIVTFAFSAAIFNLGPHSWLSWYRLAASGERAEATITATNPPVHRTCTFEFFVDSVKYQGSDQGCEFEIGESVPITYLPTDPSFATTASPLSHLIESILGSLAASVFAGLGGAWSVRSLRGRLLHWGHLK